MLQIESIKTQQQQDHKLLQRHVTSAHPPADYRELIREQNRAHKDDIQALGDSMRYHERFNHNPRQR